MLVPPPNPDDLLQDKAAFEYRFGPFRFHSELEVPELRGIGGTGHTEVRIRVSEVAGEIPDAKAFGTQCQVAPLSYLLDIPGVATFRVTGGNDVRVQVAAGAPRSDIAAYLLGSVFGALCHQNGFLPLHASAVAHGGSVTAFLGDSGAGKSTMAACLQARGYSIVSDDICLFQPQGDAMQFIPVAGWVKLWRTSLDHLGQVPEEQNRVFTADDKFRQYLDPDPLDGLALRNLVFLERTASPDDPAGLARLGTPETIARMMELTYLAYITELTGSHVRVFQQCASVLKQASAHRLTIPWDLTRMDEVLDLLERKVLAPEAGQA